MLRSKPYTLPCPRDASCSWCKTNLKLELCDSVIFGKPCRHGPRNCTYAHSSKEIDLPTVKDRVHAGIIKDADTFRTKPCFDFVATGYCPYGSRCDSIHDPAALMVSSEKLSCPSWHLKSLQLGSDVEQTDCHIDWLFDAKRNAVNTLELDSNMATYDSLFASIIPSESKEDVIVHKLTLKMMKKRTHKLFFKYVPKHKLNNKLCMVVSKAYFCIADLRSLSFEEINWNSFNPNDKSHFSVHEIAFAPYGSLEETMDKPVYLINMNEALLTPISFSEVKQINNAKKKLKDDIAKEMVFGVRSPCISRRVRFSTRTATETIQDMRNKKQMLASAYSLYFQDKYLHELVMDMLKLKVDWLLSSTIPSSPVLALEKKFREVKFDEVKMFLQGKASVDAWPNTFGHRFTNSYTMIPCTEVSYQPAKGTTYADIWSSFISNIQRENRVWEDNGQRSNFIPMMSAEHKTQKKLDKIGLEYLQDFSTDFVEDLLEQWGNVEEKHIRKGYKWSK